MVTVLRRLADMLLSLLGSLLFLFEEILWAGLGRMMAALARLPLLQRLEAWIVTLPPYRAMLLFLLPGAVILPVKLVGLALLTHGQVVAGLCVFGAGKVAGMALLTRIYALCRPQLVQIGWFATLERTILSWKARAHAFLSGLLYWQRIRLLLQQGIAAGRAVVQNFWGRFTR